MTTPDRSTGFTLLEVILALGIFAFATAMGMALFPPAVAEAGRSEDHSRGGMVAQSGLAWAQSALSDADAVYTPGNLQYNPTLAPIGTYPSATAGADLRWVVFGRKLAAGRNDYQLVAVGCRARSSEPGVQACSGEVRDAGPVSEVVLVDPTNVQAGTPLIDRATGRWARVAWLDGSTARLDRRLPAQASVQWLAVYESGAGRSPAMAVRSLRTPLAP